MVENKDELKEEIVEDVEIEEELTLDDFETEEDISLEDLDDIGFQEETVTKEEVEVLREEGKDDNEFPDIDLEAIRPIEHETKSATENRDVASDIRIINTRKNGKRIILKPSPVEELDLEDTLEVGLIEDTLIITKEGIADVKYNLKKQGNTYVIYNTKLIEDITKALELDFKNCSSIGLGEIKYVTKYDKKFLMARK